MVAKSPIVTPHLVAPASPQLRDHGQRQIVSRARERRAG